MFKHQIYSTFNKEGITLVGWGKNGDLRLLINMYGEPITQKQKDIINKWNIEKITIKATDNNNYDIYLLKKEQWKAKVYK